MSKKQPWSIWRIKSRRLRAAFAAFVGIPIHFAVLVFLCRTVCGRRHG